MKPLARLMVVAALILPVAAVLAPQRAVMARPAAHPDMVRCTVMHDLVSRSLARSTVYRGRTYYFCCADCQQEFTRHPERYVHPAVAPARQSGQGHR